jgi:hypothetical protein
MAANLISPEQLANSATMRPEDVVSDDGDDVEPAVQVEKHELLRLTSGHQALLDSLNTAKSMSLPDDTLGNSATSDASTNHVENRHLSHLLSKQLDEYQAKLTQLEESLLVADRSIQAVCINLVFYLCAIIVKSLLYFPCLIT